MADTVGQRST